MNEMKIAIARARHIYNMKEGWKAKKAHTPASTINYYYFIVGAAGDESFHKATCMFSLLSMPAHSGTALFGSVP